MSLLIAGKKYEFASIEDAIAVSNGWIPYAEAEQRFKDRPIPKPSGFVTVSNVDRETGIVTFDVIST